MTIFRDFQGLRPKRGIVRPRRNRDTQKRDSLETRLETPVSCRDSCRVSSRVETRVSRHLDTSRDIQLCYEDT